MDYFIIPKLSFLKAILKSNDCIFRLNKISVFIDFSCILETFWDCEKNVTTVYYKSILLLQDEGRKPTTNSYLMEHQPDYPGAYPVYEMQMPIQSGVNMAHKTHTLPHPHHHHHHPMHDQRPRARDDQSLGYHGGMSGN